jgi:hypothetical protein
VAWLMLLVLFKNPPTDPCRSFGAGARPVHPIRHTLPGLRIRSQSEADRTFFLRAQTDPIDREPT